MGVAGDEEKEAVEPLSVDVPAELLDATNDAADADDGEAAATAAVDGTDEPVLGDTAAADDDAEVELAAADAAVLDELIAIT